MGELGLFVFCFSLAIAIRWSSDRWKIRKFIVAFRRVQELLASPPRFREATEADARLLRRVRDTSAVDAHGGLTRLGDAVVERGDVVEGCRVFVDASRTSLLLVQSTSTTAESYTAEIELTTRIGKPLPLTRPPFHLEQCLGADVPVSRLLPAHYEFVRGATQEPLLRFETLADAIRAWEQVGARMMAWRGAQDPEQLLQRDLRMLVGPAYDVFWKRFGAQLRGEIPRARARRRDT